jgi:N-acetyl-D-muramate 6-phosphate phosphatase
MFGNVRAVLFDLDGTLIDSAPDLGAAADKMRLERGLPSLPLDKYRPMAGAGARGMLGIAFGMTPAAPDYDAMREEFFVNYESAMTDRTTIFEGVPALIASLLELGLKWGVVTNKSMRFTGPLTKQIPFFRSAGAIVGGDSTPYSKPHPGPLLEAATTNATSPPPERQECPASQQLTGTSAAMPMSMSGRPMPTLRVRSNCFRS